MDNKDLAPTQAKPYSNKQHQDTKKTHSDVINKIHSRLIRSKTSSPLAAVFISMDVNNDLRTKK